MLRVDGRSSYFRLSLYVHHWASSQAAAHARLGWRALLLGKDSPTARTGGLGGGTQFTRFSSTTVQILTQKRDAARRRSTANRRGKHKWRRGGCHGGRQCR
jgi:hypothetical protein